MADDWPDDKRYHEAWHSRQLPIEQCDAAVCKDAVRKSQMKNRELADLITKFEQSSIEKNTGHVVARIKYTKAEDIGISRDSAITERWQIVYVEPNGEVNQWGHVIGHNREDAIAFLRVHRERWG